MVRNNTAHLNVAGAAGSFPPAKPLNEIPLASIAALAAADEVERACRLAGQAYATLRGVDPTAARRFQLLLHRLTRKLTW